jgi:hypothetical protein
MKKMKKQFILFIAFITAFYSCEDLDEITQFPLTVTTEVIIPSTTITGAPFTLDIASTATNSDIVFSDNNTHSDLIDRITLQNCTLSITNPSDANFSFLQNIEVSLSASGLPEILIAWSNTTIPSTNAIELNTTNEDLTSYLIQESYSVSITATTDEEIPSDYTIQINNSFEIDAQLLGL